MSQIVTEELVRSAMPVAGGTYILLMTVQDPVQVTIGRKGRLNLSPGHYLYVGSAFGPGGLRARVGRHARQEKPRRWHIDYLRRYASLISVYFSTDTVRLEDSWSEAIDSWADTNVPMPGFGATDSQFISHLFFSHVQPEACLFHNLAGQGGQFLTP